MGSDNSSNMKEAARNQADFSLEGKEDIAWIRVSPNQKVVAFGGSGIIRVFNPLDQQFIVELEGSCYQKLHNAQTTFAFSPDSKFLAYRWDDKVRVYNLEERRAEKEIKLDDGQRARTISFSPDG